MKLLVLFGLALTLLLCFRIAQAGEVILASSADSPNLRRFAADLEMLLPGAAVRLVRPVDLPPPGLMPADTRLILVGNEALEWRLRDPSGPPTIALQVSRIEAKQLFGSQHPAYLSLLWRDPPPRRQIQLIRLALPHARRIGVVFSEDSRFIADEMRTEADSLGLTLTPVLWPDIHDSRPLGALLDQSDVLLGIDDPALFNAGSIKGILLAAYGRSKALIGPSGAFIHAGSLTTTYSNHQDWLDELTDYLRQPPEQWPRDSYPRRFKVLSNPKVARSMGVDLPDDATQEQRLEHLEIAR
ncbi:ABC transporter substrate-binding protein [Geopseudomonas aromaticivorans]